MGKNFHQMPIVIEVLYLYKYLDSRVVSAHAPGYIQVYRGIIISFKHLLHNCWINHSKIRCGISMGGWNL